MEIDLYLNDLCENVSDSLLEALAWERLGNNNILLLSPKSHMMTEEIVKLSLNLC